MLASKALAAVKQAGLTQLVVAGGVGANLTLRARLAEAAQRQAVSVFYPALEFCTDNGAMIAFAAALRFQREPSLITRHSSPAEGFTVRPRWDLEDVERLRSVSGQIPTHS